MILVTLGTQKQSFTRLLDIIEESNIKDEIIVQAGHTKYFSKKMKILDFISYEELDKLVQKADIIITHGGTGSIVGPLKKGKKVIAVPRLSKYGEHVDDHQSQIVDAFAESGYILKLDENDNLSKLLKKIKKTEVIPFKSNNDNFIKNLKNEIDNTSKLSNK